MRKFILLTWLIVTSTQLKANIGIFDFSAPLPNRCENEDCYSIEDLVKEAVKHGMDSREGVQNLFLANEAKKLQIKQLMPQIDVHSTACSGISVDTFVALTGFLFPSRWIRWRASKHLKNAERENLGSLLADRAQGVQNIYFQIQWQLWSIQVLEFYINEIDKLLKDFEIQFSEGSNRITKEHIAILKNIKGTWIYELSNLDNLTSSYSLLANAIGLNPEKDWSDIAVKPHAVVPLNAITPPKYNELWKNALNRSTEVKNINYLLKAARSTKKINYFDFLDPNSGLNLDLGFANRIKMARSNIEILEIQLKRTKMQLSNNIQNALNNFDIGLQAFPGVFLGLNALPDMRESVEQHLHDKSSPLDITRVLRYFEYAKIQSLLYINVYFIFRTSEVNLNRYTWEGNISTFVKNYFDFEVPKLLKEWKKRYSLRHFLKKKMDIIFHKVRKKSQHNRTTCSGQTAAHKKADTFSN